MSVQSGTIKTVSEKSAAAALASQMLIPKSDQECFVLLVIVEECLQISRC